MIPRGTRRNFEVLRRAFANDDVALMECKLNATGQLVDAICVVNRGEGDTLEMVPVAIIPREDHLMNLLTPPEGVEEGSEPIKETSND